MKVVICGGGVIGASTAYHLAKRGVGATIVERCGVACASSGKAGGFLARNWCGGPVAAFAKMSFDMHMELSKTFTECDYRRIDTLAVSVHPGGKVTTNNRLPSWVDGAIDSVSSLGTPQTTAQVHPFKLSNAFVDNAIKMANASLLIGIVEEVIVSHGKVTGVKVDGNVIPADVVVIAMGPWSIQAKKWFKHVPTISGDPNPSIVLRPSHPLTPHALFTEFHGREGITSPEAYPRPDGTVYLCGSAEKPKLPDDPREIKSTGDAQKMLCNAAKYLSSALDNAEVIRNDCCFLPGSRDGLPVIGCIPGVDGAYIASGHTCWGILNAPVTGACLTELILDGKCTLVDISAFDPSRFLSSK